ncbi:MAG: type II secretion system protein [Candidatus Sericytochromatia bacterium]|nr:type II secretion system protein [Candidatus Tanganyikabacteria bacterium]
MRSRINPQSGFSAVEFVVVSTMIGILAGVAFPKFMTAKDNAANSRVQQNAHKVQLAIEEYGTDHGGNYPATAADVKALVVAEKAYNQTQTYPPTPWDTQQTAAIEWPAALDDPRMGDVLGAGTGVAPTAHTHYGAISYLQPATGRYYLGATGKKEESAIVAVFLHN